MSRSNIEEFNRSFQELHKERLVLVRSSRDAALYAVSGHANYLWPTSAATLLIRSAAVVEQTINGITVRLWDDPFEWTLPESFPTSAELIAYLGDVEAARIRGFEFLKDDADLRKSIPAPLLLTTLGQLLTDTLSRSEKYLSETRKLL